MPAKHSPHSAPLSDDELDALAGLLDEHSTFDLNGLLGILHAVSVAPSVVPPSAWVPVVLPNGLSGIDAAGAQRLMGLLTRLYNDVLAGVNDRKPIVPDPEDVHGCKSFAAGFVAGAELDPEWIGDADRWTFASWAGYLGGRPEVVPRAMRATFEQHLDEAKSSLCREMGAIILAAHDSFLELRRATLGKTPAAATPRSARVGRNELCPCGSGKKYKRCCIDTGTPRPN